jgi:hypothetical protein
MLVDSNSQRGSVVLRGIEIDLDSDIGCGFIVDCCRFCEGLLVEDQIKSKYKLANTDWARLAGRKSAASQTALPHGKKRNVSRNA